MEIKTIIVLDPTAQPKSKETTVAPRIRKLEDKIKIGFLWNSKPNGDILLLSIKDRLSQKLRLAGTNWHQKDSLGSPADSATINELAANSDLVITAIADWGSCTSWSVHDSVELGKKGIPTVSICTDRFESLARIMSKNLGMPDLPLVVTHHPVGGLRLEEVRAKAERITEDIIKLISWKGFGRDKPDVIKTKVLSSRKDIIWAL